MRKAGFWKTDWFLGLALAMPAAANGELIQSRERKAYDMGVAACCLNVLGWRP